MSESQKTPQVVARVDSPPVPKGWVQYEEFAVLVRDAFVAIRSFGVDPIAIAASPNRFDDATNYDWRAVRYGSFFTEKESYLRQRDFEKDLASAPAGARQLRGILTGLEEAGWRDLFAEAYDLPWSDQSLALVLQDGLQWVVFSSNQCTEYDHVFSVSDIGIDYFGECEPRFDWRIQDSTPLKFLYDYPDDLEED
jgi:hypothetical protein